MISVMGESGRGLASYGGTRQVLVPDSGREARVMRYREKRRTRLFAKKIRYEVRKLNAERRPRMKVYVESSFNGGVFPFLFSFHCLGFRV